MPEQNVDLDLEFSTTLPVQEIRRIIHELPAGHGGVRESYRPPGRDNPAPTQVFHVRSTERCLLFMAQEIRIDVVVAEASEGRRSMHLRTSTPASNGPFVHKFVTRFHWRFSRAGGLAIVIDPSTVAL